MGPDDKDKPSLPEGVFETLATFHPGPAAALPFDRKPASPAPAPPPAAPASPAPPAAPSSPSAPPASPSAPPDARWGNSAQVPVAPIIVRPRLPLITPQISVAPTPQVPPSTAPTVSAQQGPSLDLLWFHKPAFERLQGERLLRASEELEDAWLDDRRARGAAHDRQHGQVAELTQRAPLCDIGELHELLVAEGAEAPGRRPIACVDVSVTFVHGGRDLLQRMHDVADLYVDGDGLLRSMLEVAARALACSSVPDDMCDGLCRKLVTAFGAKARGLDDAYLTTTARRMLLQERTFVVHKLMGGEHARLALVSKQRSVIAYLPTDALVHLPVAQQFRARVLVELRSRQDERDPDPFSLRMLALAAMLDESPRKKQ